MAALVRLWDLVTSDTLTFTATSVLALAILGLVVVISLPARDQPLRGGSRRSALARALVASGASAVEISRKTGFSRDALSLMLGSVGQGARKKTPGTARVALPAGASSAAPPVEAPSQAAS